jgi:hypothetical protein
MGWIPLGTVDGWMNGWIDFALGCMYHYRKWGVFFFFFLTVFVAFGGGKERKDRNCMVDVGVPVC